MLKSTQCNFQAGNSEFFCQNWEKSHLSSTGKRSEFWPLRAPKKSLSVDYDWLITIKVLLSLTGNRNYYDY